MVSPLLNVQQAYYFIVQDDTQRQLTSETTKNFSIVATFWRRQNNYNNKPKGKHYDHYNKDGYTIENCCTLKFYCKFCNMRGHTQERCKFKNSTWTSNYSRGQGNRNQSSRGNSLHTSPTTNVVALTKHTRRQFTRQQPYLPFMWSFSITTPTAWPCIIHDDTKQHKW